jgi:hypothetical protein
MAKGWLIIGFAAGFVAGSAAGRKQFEKIKSTASDVWERPEVQRVVKKVDGFVEDKAPAVHDVGAAVAGSVSNTPAEADDSSTPENKPEAAGSNS